jgi:amino acid transporter
VQWSTKFVDPAAGFAVGWAYWFNYFITIANELQAVNTVLKFWTDAVPIAAWMTIFWLVIVLVNVGMCISVEVFLISATEKSPRCRQLVRRDRSRLLSDQVRLDLRRHHLRHCTSR